MERYKVILAYDGTAFDGFQVQAGRRTVQGELEGALRSLGWRGAHLLAAGRTDSGVHALGQVVAFDLDWRHAPEALARALNTHLPRDVRCTLADEVEASFHPRHAARCRVYRYRLVQSAFPDPIEERYAWRVWPALDFGRMQAAAHWVVGRHDFAAFGTAPRPQGHTRREVYLALWQAEGARLDFWIEGDAFLFRMVRTMVGSLVRLGQGRLSPEAFRRLLALPPEGRAGPAAPARGLCLVRIDFREEEGGSPARAPEDEDLEI